MPLLNPPGIIPSSALTNHGVVTGKGNTTNLGSTGAGTVGQVLTSAGAGADPVFDDLPAETFVGTVTDITAGVGLEGGTITDSGTIDLTIPVTVAHGGTGAETVEDARDNLGLGSMSIQDFDNVAITGGTITGMGTPTNATDVANKDYTDAVAQGLSIRNSVQAATAAVLSNSPVYDNGTAGLGATLTAGTNGVLTVDGYVVLLSDRILVKNQAAAAQNGIYDVTTLGTGGVKYILTRSTDADTDADIVPGIFCFTIGGSTNTGASFVMTTTGTIVVGTTALNFTQFSSASSISAGTGLTKVGNVVSLIVPVTVANGGTEATTAAGARTSLGLGTIAVENTPLVVAKGGTGDTTLTNHGVLLGQGTSAVAITTAGTAGQVLTSGGASADPAFAGLPYFIQSAASDETTALSTGTAKVTFRAPHAFTLTAARASLTTSSSSGTPTIDIKKNGTTIFSTKITIDASELTSVTAAVPSVLASGPISISDDDAFSVNIDVAGTNAAGLKVTLIGTIP